MRRPIFREFNGRQIKWRSDKSGVVHACEGSIIQGGDMRLWTMCDGDVPTDQARWDLADPVSCPICLEVADASPVKGRRTAGPANFLNLLLP